jgi:hypothetical protein
MLDSSHYGIGSESVWVQFEEAFRLQLQRTSKCGGGPERPFELNVVQGDLNYGILLV